MKVPISVSYWNNLNPDLISKLCFLFMIILIIEGYLLSNTYVILSAFILPLVVTFEPLYKGVSTIKKRLHYVSASVFFVILLTGSSFKALIIPSFITILLLMFFKRVKTYLLIFEISLFVMCQIYLLFNLKPFIMNSIPTYLAVTLIVLVLYALISSFFLWRILTEGDEPSAFKNIMYNTRRYKLTRRIVFLIPKIFRSNPKDFK